MSKGKERRWGRTCLLVIFFLFFILWGSSVVLAAQKWSSLRLDPSLLRGPLKVSADSTLSKEQGKKIEAQGNVSLRYEMESGETLECYSQFLKYEEASGRGELWGAPRAIWSRKDATLATLQKTILTAERIVFHLRESELIAQGKVRIFQGSSTLTAQETHFIDSEKKLVATGDRPTFTNQESQQEIQISAEEIITLAELKKVQFREKVRGKIKFIQ